MGEYVTWTFSPNNNGIVVAAGCFCGVLTLVAAGTWILAAVAALPAVGQPDAEGGCLG
jgi:hypothetical protein